MLKKVKLKYTLGLLITAALISMISIAVPMLYEPQSDVVIHNEIKEILRADPALVSDPVLEQQPVEQGFWRLFYILL